MKKDWLNKYQDGGEINFKGVKNAVRNVESLNGKLMWNPESTATGFYGQRFSEIKNDYKGTRKDFVKDTVAQNKYFKDRFYKGIQASDTTPLKKDANDLYKEYSPQIDNFNYSKEDIAVLSNFLGRDGARQYLGYHIRDGKPLDKVFPKLYGQAKKQNNKTPKEYLKQARPYYKNQTGGSTELESVIQDDRGQWAHPGKVTKINSNNITMQGVNYPVLGISNTGDEQLMMPEEDYKFDGDSVTEYPLAKNGSVNKINYNTPQPEGWLNKYQ
jgi:hypothetical protein